MMSERAAAVRPNRVALSLVLATGLVIGLAPFLLFMRVPYLALVCFAYTAIVVAWRARGLVSHATEAPGALEWLLAGWNAVAVGAIACLVGYVWYVVAYAFVWSLGHAASGLGWAIGLNPSSVASVVSAFFVALFALAGPVLLADEVPGKLYPLVAGTRSAFFALAEQPWKALLVAAGGVAGAVVGVALLGLEVQEWKFTLALALYFAFSGAPLLKLGQRARPSAAVLEAIRALTRLFGAAGYKLIERPRTGSPEVDPLITCVDLLALAGERGYAVQAKVIGAGESDVEWKAAADVRRGAKALQQAMREGETSSIEIEPYLVVVGGRIGDDLRAFCAEEQVKLAHFADIEALRRGAGADAADADLRQSAAQRLQVPPVGAADSALTPSIGAAG